MPAKRLVRHKAMKFNPTISSIEEAKEKFYNARIWLGERTPEFDSAIRTLRNQSTGEAKTFLLEKFAEYHNPKKKTKIPIKRIGKFEEHKVWTDYENIAREYERLGKKTRAIEYFELAAKEAYTAGNKEKKILIGFNLVSIIEDAAINGDKKAQKQFSSVMKEHIFPICKNIEQKMKYYQRFGEFFEVFDDYSNAVFNYAMAAGYAEKIKEKETAKKLRERITFLKNNR